MIWSIVTDYTFQIVSLGTALLGALSGLMGSFLVLKGESLLGDTIGHSSFLGVTLSFLLFRQLSLPILLAGALVSGIVSAWIINLMAEYSKLKFDSALALNLAWFFGMGIVLLTYIQNNLQDNSAGLSDFIFGQASGMLSSDVRLMLIIGLFILIFVVLFWKEFKLISFDPEFAQINLPGAKNLSRLLSLLIVLTIILGLQSVGVVLISSLLIAPAVAARQWTERFGLMVFLAAIFGSVSGFLGTLISTMYSNTPTGPSIVLVASTFAFVSLLFAPKRGILSSKRKNKRNEKTLRQSLDQVKEER